MKAVTLYIEVTRRFPVHVWRGDADPEEHEPAGWRALIRTDQGADLLVGPYRTRADLMAAVERARRRL